ncbi:MAG: hypothetical protein KDN22_33880 [Verrucomicrobiae bacterium]|nr:hypothetical protein [Verrucomicrobiae bacterium]
MTSMRSIGRKELALGAILLLLSASGVAKAQGRPSIESALKALAAGEKPPSILSIYYSDLHPEHGLELSIRGKGGIVHRPPTKEGQFFYLRSVDADDWKALAGRLLEMKIWEHQESTRTKLPDERLVSLHLQLDDQKTTVFEWVHGAPGDGRLEGVREIVEAINWTEPVPGDKEHAALTSEMLQRGVGLERIREIVEAMVDWTLPFPGDDEYAALTSRILQRILPVAQNLPLSEILEVKVEPDGSATFQFEYGVTYENYEVPKGKKGTGQRAVFTQTGVQVSLCFYRGPEQLRAAVGPEFGFGDLSCFMLFGHGSKDEVVPAIIEVLREEKEAFDKLYPGLSLPSRFNPWSRK